jgi:hypothetical protein
MNFRIHGDRLVGTSDRLRIAFDTATGAIVELTNVVTGHAMASPGPAPWRLLGQGTTSSVWPPATAAAGYTLDELAPGSLHVHAVGDEATMRWETSSPGVEVTVVARFDDDGALELWPGVTVAEGVAPPAHFTYPIIEPRPLGEDDALLFPAHSGWLIADPLSATTTAPYPDGFHGCSVQVMAYLAPGAGGFAVACHDPFVTHKELAFSAAEMSVRHDAWDLRRGADLDLGYPVVITALQRGDWFEAAEHYRSWAAEAPWAHLGRNVERAGRDRPAWLFDEVGLSIWGTPSSLDWSHRYRLLAEAATTPLHVVSGWDWPATRPHYVGKEGWFPARFHPANLEAWAGHHVTPYLNDLFVSYQADGFHDKWEPNLVFPYQFFRFTVFSERPPSFIDGDDPPPDPRVVTDIDFFVCPVTEIQRDLHTWRDARLVADNGLAGVFYDISSGNPFAARCLRTEHGHTPGWSRDVLVAYADNNAASRAAMAEAIGSVPAQGVETIVEHVIADIDFYVARSVAGPLGGLEAMTLGPETPPGGGRELVPLFQAIYHDIGPVHEDGWVTFEHTFGDLFYWVVSRIAVTWGGILSLHYANNPPELFPGAESGEVISWDGGYHRFEGLEPPDQGFIDFAAEMGRLRVGIGKPYLAYGRMVAPLPLQSPPVSLRYHRSNPVLSGITRQGAWEVPRVVHGAWRAADGSIGLFLVNVADQPHRLTGSYRPAWGCDDGEAAIHRAEGTAAFGDGVLELDIALPARRPVLVVVTPAD